MLSEVCQTLQNSNVRSSLFLDVFTHTSLQQKSLEKISPDRIELYTEKYARDESTIATYKKIAEEISGLGIGINAGHDLNTLNLKKLVAEIPAIKEVSIGHALITESLYDGFTKVIATYHEILGY